MSRCNAMIRFECGSVPRVVLLLCGVVLVNTFSGCAFGPRVLEKTHGRYQESIRQVDEEQVLRNLVHLRYSEVPIELTVSSIATQYELAGSAEARPFFIAPNPSNSNLIFKTFTSILPDLSVSGANRPTITLVPGDNSETIQRFLTPIPMETLLFLTETSWPIGVIFRLWVERLNGVPNAVTASGPVRGVISDFQRFLRIVEILQYAQDHELASIRSEIRETPLGGPIPAGSVTGATIVEAAKAGMEYHPSDDGQTWTLVRKQNKMMIRVNPDALDHPEMEEMTRLMNLRPGQLHYDVVVAPGDVPDPLLFPRPPSTELRISPRSTSQVYFYLSNGVEVPCEHIESGVAKPTTDAEGRPMDGRVLTHGLFQVHACKGHKPPPTAYVAIKNRGYWYYIDDRDQASKSTLVLVLQLSRIDFGTQKATGPILTLPVGR
jgi:hypothetical protein